jgi:hypothetical protein
VFCGLLKKGNSTQSRKVAKTQRKDGEFKAAETEKPGMTGLTRIKAKASGTGDFYISRPPAVPTPEIRR